MKFCCTRAFVIVVCVMAWFAATASAQSADVVLYAANGKTAGNWVVTKDSTAAGGARLANADKGAAKLASATAAPTDYFDLSFQASAGVGYRLWMRGKAAGNGYANDSAFVQFSDSVTASGAASYRIGSTASTIYTVEDCNGCGVSGWGWNDNFYGSTPGALIYFKATGSHTIRVQVREDGLSIDQIVLSPVTYAKAAPGAPKNDTAVLPQSAGSVTDPAAPTTAPAPAPVPQPDPGTDSATGGPVFEAAPDGFRIAGRTGTMRAPVTLLLSASAKGTTSTDVLTYTWNFGDGTPAETHTDANSANAKEASRQNTVHTFTKAGTFTVKVVVRDPAGHTSSREGSVTVDAPLATSGEELKVMQMNAYKGRSTDTRTEQSKLWLQARWMAGTGADVILVQETMGSAMADKIKKELNAATPGTSWNYFYRSDAGANTTSAQGVAIFSRLPILTTQSHAYQPCQGIQIVQRAAVAITVNVHGRNIGVIDTHLSSYSGTEEQACRQRQAAELRTWAASIGQARVITGDLNADPAEPAISDMLNKGYADTWTMAKDRRIAYSGNDGDNMRTRSERIDYILVSTSAPMALQAVQLLDTRDYTNDNAINSLATTKISAMNAAPRASDHDWLLATFDVR